jgi:hypothetical protein
MWMWIVLAALVGFAGLRYRRRLRPMRSGSGIPPRVDDAAMRSIVRDGTLAAHDDEDEPLDPDEIARAEDEFWNEPWDEPEEYSP